MRAIADYIGMNGNTISDAEKIYDDIVKPAMQTYSDQTNAELKDQLAQVREELERMEAKYTELSEAIKTVGVQSRPIHEPPQSDTT